jgi:predicted phosphodiesterase
MVVFLQQIVSEKPIKTLGSGESARRTSRFLIPLVILLACQFFAACTVDIPGLIVSHNLGERLEARNTFNFLTSENLTLDLPDVYSFIVVSDTHIINGETYGLLEKLNSVVNAAGSDIKFVVFTGDVTQCGYEKDINTFIDIAKTLGVPCYPILGNHDIYFNNWSNWKRLIGSSTYKIEKDGSSTTLLMLDTANACFGKVQLDWLDNELKTAADKHKKHVFVFTHTNLFVESPADIQQLTDTRERARVLSMLSGRCDSMFAGHLHKRIIRDAGGVKYLAIDGYVEDQIYCRVSVTNSSVTYTFE